MKLKLTNNANSHFNFKNFLNYNLITSDSSLSSPFNSRPIFSLIVNVYTHVCVPVSTWHCLLIEGKWQLPGVDSLFPLWVVRFEWHTSLPADPAHWSKPFLNGVDSGRSDSHHGAGMRTVLFNRNAIRTRVVTSHFLMSH